MILPVYLNFLNPGDHHGIQKPSRTVDFADLVIANCLEQNRSIKLVQRHENPIEGVRITQGLRVRSPRRGHLVVRRASAGPP